MSSENEKKQREAEAEKAAGGRPCTPAGAKALIARYEALFDGVCALEGEFGPLEDEIRKAAEALRKKEAAELLRQIPIEEINRNKEGFRVKALRERGIETIGDIAPKTVRAITNIKGIGAESAHAIRAVVDGIVEKTEASTKITLNADDRSKEANRLLAAVSKYRAVRNAAAGLVAYPEHYTRDIVPAAEKLRPATGPLRWLFASRRQRDEAREAFAFLESGLESGIAAETEKRLERLRRHTGAKADVFRRDFSENPVAFTNVLEHLVPELLGNDDAVYGLPEDLALEIRDEEVRGAGLLCELRRYQEWGVKYILHQGKVLLGDEMGLGKTVQAIAAMVSLHNSGATHFVVVCPAGVLTNWCREIKKMSTLDVIRVHGSGRLAALEAWKEKGGVAVTTYETTPLFRLPEDFRFCLLVADEAHYIKNPAARRTVNVRRLSAHAERLLFMTGTALENRADEMVALIRMLRPPIAEKIADMTYLSAAPEFRRTVAPVYYRRKREDVLTELPEMIESREWCTLGKAEEKKYEAAVLARRYADARRVSWNVDDLKDSSKAMRMLELIDEAAEDGRKIIVFSFFLDTLRKVRRLLGDRCPAQIDGSVPPKRRQEIVDAFDAAPAGTVLAAQIQSGGTGMNIQTASVVILCEPQFKPSTENQAVSRAYRMGQTRNVLVYRLLADDTIDERLTELLESKQEIFDAFADESVAASESRSVDERAFASLIDEEIARITAKHARPEEDPEDPDEPDDEADGPNGP